MGNLSCPKCSSNSLWKYGRDYKGRQKYCCKKCRTQFVPEASRHKQLNIKCPWCGCAMEIYKRRKFYTRYRCSSIHYKNRKPCRCKINIYNIPDEVLNTVSAVTNGKTNFKYMRYPQQIIIKALRLFFLRKMSTRQIAADLAEEYSIKVSHVTIYKWAVKFSYLFSSIAAQRSLKVSDEWHLDETVVKVAGKKYYLWVALCSETRVVLAWHLSPYRDTIQAIRLLRAAIRNSKTQPAILITDRYPAYVSAIYADCPDAEHIRVSSFDDLISNNTLERFMGSFKDWYKKLRGFKSYDSAVALISFWITCYNFVRPHSALNNWSPAEVAGFTPKFKDNRWVSMIA